MIKNRSRSLMMMFLAFVICSVLMVLSSKQSGKYDVNWPPAAV